VLVLNTAEEIFQLISTTRVIGMSKNNIIYSPISTLCDKEVDPNSSLNTRTLKVWNNNKASCFTNNSKEQFYKMWAIELGLVENIYGWGRGVTIALIHEGMNIDVLMKHAGSNVDDPESNLKTIANHIATLTEVEMGFVNGQEKLNANYIRQLHSKLLENQEFHDVYVENIGFQKRDLKKGIFKDVSNDPYQLNADKEREKIMAFCPPENCTQEIINLCDLFHSTKIQKASPEARAAWLHHRFVKIHPFSDGNGRVARTLASLVLMKSGLPPLIIRRDEDREGYLDALKVADNGNLQILTNIFIDRTKADIFKLIADSSSIDDSLKIAEESLIENIELRKERANSLFSHVHSGAQNKFNTLARKLHEVIYKSRRNNQASKIEDIIVKNPNAENSHSKDFLIEPLSLDYKPRLGDVSAYIAFQIVTDYKFTIIIHLHERDYSDGGGFVLMGIMVEEELDSGEANINLIPINPLMVSVLNSVENATLQTIAKWAGEAVEKGLNIWGKSQ